MDVRGALSEPGGLGVQSVTTLITYISPQSYPGWLPIVELILMFNHMLICSNGPRVLNYWIPFERSKVLKNTYHKNTLFSSPPTLWVPSSFTSLLLSRLAIAVNYRGQNRYEIPFPRFDWLIDVRWSPSNYDRVYSTTLTRLTICIHRSFLKYINSIA